MRLSTSLLVTGLVLLNTAAGAQITLNHYNAPLEKVLLAIEKQTKYVFLYDPEELKTVIVTVEVKNATLRETLSKMFKNLPIEDTIIGNNVLLKKRQRNAKHRK